MPRSSSILVEQFAVDAEGAAAAFFYPGAQAGFVALFGWFEVGAVAERFGKVGLERDGGREVAFGVHLGVVAVRVAIALAVAEVFHQFGRRVAQVKRYRIVARRLDV